MSQLPPDRPSLLPIVIGFTLAGVFILALGFWAAHRSPGDSHPTIRLLSPSRDTVARGTVTLRFHTSVPLHLQPTGWGAGRFHIHAMVNATELMPGAASIRGLGDRVYEWSIPAPDSAATLQLFWSLPNHARVPAGASQPIRIQPR